ncbi:glutamyl-tRNA(Gln) amidotransferase [Aureococcus anophagefferens]|uniref:Glutamyl-tRNA(Gln) amidotransferase n=1 Tax=Aureococcus anophagefferens TaxID=44056 RepID=A0ABR1FRH0_AURAN
MVALGAVAPVALRCASPSRRRTWDRKSYFYPDLPKGFQITQKRSPLAVGGSVEILGDADARGGGENVAIGVESAHLEEDSAKLSYKGDTFDVDFNRSGCALVEIVSKPELRSGEGGRARCSGSSSDGCNAARPAATWPGSFPRGRQRRSRSGAGQAPAAWLSGEVAGAADKLGLATYGHLAPRDLADLLVLMGDGSLGRRAAKDLLPALLGAPHGPVRAEVADRDLGQIADAAALDAFVADVLAAHPDELAKFAAGAGQLRKLFLGKAMAASRGRADPAGLNAALDRALPR